MNKSKHLIWNLFLVCVIVFGSSCKSESQSVANVAPSAIIAPTDKTDLQTILLRRGIYFGTALNVDDILQKPPRPAGFLDSLAPYFNIYVMNVGFAVTEGRRGIFNFSSADKVAEFALAHNARVRAHPLVSGTRLPEWATNGNYPPDSLQAWLKNHVQTIVRHFKTKYPTLGIDWEVTNEVTCNPGSKDICDHGIKQVAWSNIHKPGSNDPRDYVELAYKWVREVDPNAKMYLNESMIELAGNNKIDLVYDLVKYLLSQKTPITGIGFQSHIRLHERSKVSVNTLTSYFNMFTQLGLETRITELDVLMSSGLLKGQPVPILAPTDAQYQEQANIYRIFMQAALRTKNFTEFTMGESYDGISWTKNYWQNVPFHPHLLNENLKPKMAYKFILDEARKDTRNNPEK